MSPADDGDRSLEAWLFPGQGSQQRGMGAALFARYPQHVALAERVLGFPIPELCNGSDDGRLRQTQYLQPAMFVVNALACMDRLEHQPEPDYVAGHSLGELNALCCAGCIDFETGLRLVRRRGELMGRELPAGAEGGGMAAVVGLSPDRVVEVLERSRLHDDVDVANLNSPRQVVLSGPEGSVQALRAAVVEAGGRFVPLNVSAAFHSRAMAQAADEFAELLAEVRFAGPRIPVIANVTAEPYTREQTAELLARQIRSPVRWQESMTALAAAGVRRVVEVGPGSVLTRLWQECLTEAPPPTRSRPRFRGQDPGNGGENEGGGEVSPEALGSAAFRRDHGIRYAYLAGSMFRGVASTDLVIRMGRAGLLGYFGAGGLSLPAVERALGTIRAGLPEQASFGMNLLASLDHPQLERDTVELYLRHDVRFVEAAAYTQITAPLVWFRCSGARRGPDERPVPRRRVLAKVSRPELAAAFMRPAPEAIVEQLVRDGRLDRDEAAAARDLPLSDDLCVEADSGGHTDAGVALTLVPTIVRLRDGLAPGSGIRVGASGGIGSPEAVAAAFVLGADFVLTGSINQCSPEAGTSPVVKDMLAELDVQDTTYAPAGDMFELGARVQVMRRGTLFAARANKLYQLYRQHDSLDDLDERTRSTIEEIWFRRSIADVWEETRRHHIEGGNRERVVAAEANPKQKMALVFRWYFARTTEAALAGIADEKANFQVHCGPAMGAFNRFVAGTDLADWRNRHVDVIAERLMSGAARVLGNLGTRHGARHVPLGTE